MYTIRKIILLNIKFPWVEFRAICSIKWQFRATKNGVLHKRTMHLYRIMFGSYSLQLSYKICKEYFFLIIIIQMWWDSFKNWGRLDQWNQVRESWWTLVRHCDQGQDISRISLQRAFMRDWNFEIKLKWLKTPFTGCLKIHCNFKLHTQFW